MIGDRPSDMARDRCPYLRDCQV